MTPLTAVPAQAQDTTKARRCETNPVTGLAIGTDCVRTDIQKLAAKNRRREAAENQAQRDAIAAQRARVQAALAEDASPEDLRAMRRVFGGDPEVPVTPKVAYTAQPRDTTGETPAPQGMFGTLRAWLFGSPDDEVRPKSVEYGYNNDHCGTLPGQKCGDRPGDYFGQDLAVRFGTDTNANRVVVALKGELDSTQSSDKCINSRPAGWKFSPCMRDTYRTRATLGWENNQPAGLPSFALYGTVASANDPYSIDVMKGIKTGIHELTASVYGGKADGSFRTSPLSAERVSGGVQGRVDTGWVREIGYGFSGFASLGGYVSATTSRPAGGAAVLVGLSDGGYKKATFQDMVAPESTFSSLYAGAGVDLVGYDAALEGVGETRHVRRYAVFGGSLTSQSWGLTGFLEYRKQFDSEVAGDRRAGADIVRAGVNRAF